MSNQEEFQKCVDSPYYFFTTYFKVNGQPAKTIYSEEEFNKIFKQMSELNPLKLYTIKR
jgi:hypothetical protein